MIRRETDLPDQTGRVVVITGASAGLGLESTRALAARGATVVMATRDATKTQRAAERVRRAVPGAQLERVALDLADLSSVSKAATEIHERFPRVDVLLCNAGLMATPQRRTVDGFELQMGVNHVGHAALVAQLVPALQAADAARVVIVTSEGYRLGLGQLDPDDLRGERGPYLRWLAYVRSKLANLVYAQELARRLGAAGSPVIATAAHPGLSRTDLQTTGGAMDRSGLGRVWRATAEVAATAVGHHPALAALPQLAAASAPDVANGSYWGPRAVARGAPGRQPIARGARDEVLGARLWASTERATGITHDLSAG